jgi:predicted PurR-regulated permease PerM
MGRYGISVVDSAARRGVPAEANRRAGVSCAYRFHTPLVFGVDPASTLAFSLRPVPNQMADPIDVPAAEPARSRVDIRGMAVTIVAAAATIYVMREGASLVAPILGSVLLAYALEPLVAFVCRGHLPRTLAVVLVFALLIAGVAAVGLLARPQVAAFLDALPATVRGVEQSIERARQDVEPSGGPSALENLRNAAKELEATLDAASPRPTRGVARVTQVPPPFSVRAYVAAASLTLAAATLRALAIALLTLLLLLRGEALKRKLIAIAGPRAQQKITHDVIKAIDRQIERYLLARLLISAIVAASTWLGLWALGVRQPFVLGLIAGVLNVMPFIGPAAAVTLIALIAFAQFHTLEMTAAAGGWAGIVAVLEGNLISPWLTSRAGESNTVAVFVSVLFWGWMWDVWGLVLAIPILVAIKAAADHIEPMQPLGELLGR